MTYIPELSGTIKIWHSTTIPYGWLVCDGTNGTPDLRGKVPLGYNSSDGDFNTIGNTGGEKTHTLSIAEMPQHNHVMKFDYVFVNIGVEDEVWQVGSDANDSTENAGSGNSHNNLQPYIVTNYIMKA